MGIIEYATSRMYTIKLRRRLIKRTACSSGGPKIAPDPPKERLLVRISASAPSRRLDLVDNWVEDRPDDVLGQRWSPGEWSGCRRDAEEPRACRSGLQASCAT